MRSMILALTLTALIQYWIVSETARNTQSHFKRTKFWPEMNIGLRGGLTLAFA